MKINVTQVFKGFEKDIMYLDEAEQKPRTLQFTIIEAVLTPKEKDTPQQKMDKYRIFQKIEKANKEIELTAEEITMIKQLIGESKPPLIVGQAWDMLEGITK